MKLFRAAVFLGLTVTLCSAQTNSVVQEEMAALAARAERGDANGSEYSVRVLEYGSSLLVTETGQIEDVPEFARRTASRVSRELPHYNATWIVAALSPSGWPLLRLADPEPALRSIIRTLSAPPGSEIGGRDGYTWVNARQAAIRRFHELNPGSARMVLVDELQHFRPTMDFLLSELLPVESVPPMDETLLQKLAVWRRSGAKYRTQIPVLVAKYLSARSAARVKAVFESLKETSCQPELLAYFVRVEPDYAEKFLKNFRWNISHPMNQCGLLYQSDTFGMHPVLENYLIRNLRHDAFGVKWGAALALRAHGSAKAEQPLQDAFRTLHDYWASRLGNLDEAPKQAAIEVQQLETIFRSAIAWGHGWLVDADGLRKLADLCLSVACRNASLQDAAQWEQKPLRVEIAPSDFNYGFQGSVVQYRELQGVESVLQKLAQFPMGTEFELHVRAAPLDRDQIVRQIRQFATESGFLVR